MSASEVAAMAYPARCWSCRHIHDAAKVTVEVRYSDCSAWRCPNCGLLIDDRPERWGGCLTGREVVELLEKEARA